MARSATMGRSESTLVETLAAARPGTSSTCTLRRLRPCTFTFLVTTDPSSFMNSRFTVAVPVVGVLQQYPGVEGVAGVALGEEPGVRGGAGPDGIVPSVIAAVVEVHGTLGDDGDAGGDLGGDLARFQSRHFVDVHAVAAARSTLTCCVMLAAVRAHEAQGDHGFESRWGSAAAPRCRRYRRCSPRRRTRSWRGNWPRWNRSRPSSRRSGSTWPARPAPAHRS